MTCITGTLTPGWSEASLVDLVSSVVDNRGKSAPTSPHGIPLIATNCISNNGLYPLYLNVRYVSEETYQTWFRGHPKPGDIIFVNKGTPGNVALVPDPVDFCFAQDMVALRPDESVIDGLYLFAALRSPQMQDQVQALSVGTTIPHLKKSDFSRLHVPLPSSREQRFIGHLYYELSKKIEVNRRINRTLEAMAQALFKHWFVDFGPFQDGEFVDSELGMIPKGWRVALLGDIAQNMKTDVDPQAVMSETPYFGLADLPKGSITLDAWGRATDSTSTKRAVTRGQILFGKLRPYFKKVGVAPADGVCSTDILVIVPKRERFYGMLLCQLIRQEFIDYTESVSEGTRMPRVSWDQMVRYPLPLPDVATTEMYNRLMTPWVNVIVENVWQNRALVATRDYLLPRLLSGEIPVAVAEESVAGG